MLAVRDVAAMIALAWLVGEWLLTALAAYVWEGLAARTWARGWVTIRPAR